jgi:hypothetical protein
MAERILHGYNKGRERSVADLVGVMKNPKQNKEGDRILTCACLKINVTRRV